MTNPSFELDKTFAYADYLSWDSKERYEIIDGIAYAMASPTARHQRISRELMNMIDDFLKSKPCEVLAAPFDVRYWIVNADTLNVMVNQLSDGRYVSIVYKDTVKSSVLPGLTIDLDTVRANSA